MLTSPYHAIKLAWLFSAFLFLAIGIGFAQSTGATLQGGVTDEQGGALPGATVTITNIETGQVRTAATDAQGWYRAPALPPGRYELRAELPGFVRQVRAGLTLTVGQEATINMALAIATLAETVTVTADTPLVETTKSSIGTTVTRGQLDSLPLAGRNFNSLANLAPGITGVGSNGVTTGGQINRNNTFLIDGTSNDENGVAGQRGGLSLEAVREFVVMANQFAAEFGQASGAIVSVVTRSGTNQLQGRGFLFHRDDSFDAQDPFSKAQGSGKAPFGEQRLGAFLGGPIVRDRLHYFGSYEGLRRDETTVITVPQVPVSEREYPKTTRGHQSFVRADYQLPKNQVLSLRYRGDVTTGVGDNIGGLNTFERGFDTSNRFHDYVASHTAVLSSRALNEFRFLRGYLYRWWDTQRYSPDGTPAINRPSGNFGKASNMPQGWDEVKLQFVNNFSYTVGSHDLKLGADIQLIDVDVWFLGNKDGTFQFRTDAPFNPNDPSTYPFQYTRTLGDPNDPRNNRIYGFFVQDTWRFSQNLTFNAGVRYDTENAFTEAKFIDTPDDRNNFAPRLGFAWDPFKDGRTAVRGGYGHYYDQSFNNITGNITLAARSTQITVLNPGYPDPFSRGSVVPTQPSTTVAAPIIQTPSTRTASLGIKREIVGGFAVSVDGVYSRGYDLFNAVDINYPDAVTGVRPNPNFLRIIQYETTGHSWHKALLLGIERRSGRGPSFGASYTLSDSVRDVEDFGFQAADQHNRAAEKALANNHRRHQVVANVTWALPFGFQLGTLVQARSGLPWTITTGSDNNSDTNVNDRPDLANPNGDPTDRSSYDGNFTGRAGNLGRNTAIGPAYFTVDARVSKIVQFGRRRLEAFVEAFNATNYANFGLPNGNLRAAQFGRPTALASNATPRQVELGIRFDF